LEVGWFYFDKQRLDQAELHLRACVLIAGRYLERIPHDREERLRMADAYRGLARVHSARGDLDRARPAFGTALGIYRSLVEATPDERDLQDRIAVTLQSLWIVDQQSLRFTQANEAGLEAAGIWMRHRETSQTVQDPVKKVWTLVFLATEAFRSGDFEKADRLLEIVIGEEEDLLASPDRNRVVRDGVARAHSIRAKILAQNGKLTEAIGVWEAGLAFVKGRHLDLHVAERPVLRALSGSYEAAAAEAREELRQYSDEPAALVLGARVFAEAGKMAACDTALPENKRSETAEACFLEAMQMLEDSRRSGAFQTPVVRALLGAPGLDPLRARDDFQALLRVISPSGEFPEDVATPDTTGP
jgi:tetratricopeptide (TPR) repeat protein